MTFIGRGLALIVILASGVYGYGGFGATLSFVDVTDLNQRLTELNTLPNPNGWNGSDTFKLKGPLWWVGGHGGGLVGDVTLAGSGAATLLNSGVDSLVFESGGVMGQFEVAYRYAPIENVWIRPCLDIGGQTWGCFVHSRESFSDPNFSRWFLNWSVTVQPGLDVTGWLRYQEEHMVGVFAKVGYSVPLYGPSWYGDESPPNFDIQGLTLSFGLRFDESKSGPMRI